MLQTKSKAIDGLEVKVTEFAGQRNFNVLIEMAQTIGPALGASGVKPTDDKAKKPGQTKSILDQDLDIGAMVNALMKNLTRDRAWNLVQMLLETTYINDRGAVDQDVFDETFKGPQLWRLPQVLRFVVEVNFGDFSSLGRSIMSLSDGDESSDSNSRESSANA